jgi:hypothetical protein
MQLQLADRLPLLANATCSALHCRRFSDTFDLHQPLEGLPVTMAQLLAISHDIVLRGQQQKALQAQQQQSQQQQQQLGWVQTDAPQQQQQVSGESAGLEDADAPEAAAAPLSPTEQQQHTKRQKMQKQKAIELNPQQQRQADHIARQMQQLGVSSGKCTCRPIRNARAGVVAFLPRNTDLQQLSELAGKCFCTLQQQQQQQGEAVVEAGSNRAAAAAAGVAKPAAAQQQQQQQELAVAAAAAAAGMDSSGELPSVSTSSLCGDGNNSSSNGNSGELQKFYSIDPDSHNLTSQQQQQHDVVLARGPPERFFSIESTFSADYAGPLLHSLCSVEAHPLLAEAIAEAEAELEAEEAEAAEPGPLQEVVTTVITTESNKRQLPQEEETAFGAPVGGGAAAAQQGTPGGAVLEAVEAAVADAAPAVPNSPMYISPAVATGAAAAAACTAARTAESAGAHGLWRVERNILNDHFKGVTVYCGWQE